MSSVGVYGMIGGCIGTLAGWVIGGPTTAVALLGQLGCAAGIKIASYETGLHLVEKVANKALKIIDVAANYSLGTGAVCVLYYMTTRNGQQQCEVSPADISCAALKWINVGLVASQSLAIAYLTKKHIDQMDKSQKEVEDANPSVTTKSPSVFDKLVSGSTRALSFTTGVSTKLFSSSSK